MVGNKYVVQFGFDVLISCFLCNSQHSYFLLLLFHVDFVIICDCVCVALHSISGIENCASMGVVSDAVTLNWKSWNWTKAPNEKY